MTSVMDFSWRNIHMLARKDLGFDAWTRKLSGGTRLDARSMVGIKVRSLTLCIEAVGGSFGLDGGMTGVGIRVLWNLNVCN